MDNDNCIFCKIINGKEPCHKIWENEEFLAFLSIFPNTEGFAIVTTKKHYPSYACNLPDDILTKLILATKTVALLIDKAFDDVGRTGIMFEGFGVDHVHAKLFPMHGTKDTVKQWEPLTAHVDKYFKKYEGYLSSHDYIRANDKELEKTARKIRQQ
jgi:histidine triad (HIT) family protein